MDAGLASPVSNAVRSLNNLSDFSLDVSNGNFDNYGGITDSLLSAEASKDSKVEPTETNHHSGGGGGQPQRGPLLDFKSAFSDLSFLQDSLDLGHDDLQRTLQQQSNAARSSNNSHVPSPHSVDLNPMEFIEQNHGAGG